MYCKSLMFSKNNDSLDDDYTISTHWSFAFLPKPFVTRILNQYENSFSLFISNTVYMSEARRLSYDMLNNTKKYFGYSGRKLGT